MTPPALVVLTLALVCSTISIATGQTADHTSEHATHIREHAYNPKIPTNMRAGTKNENYIVNNELAINKINKENIINNIYTQIKDIDNKKNKINGQFDYKQINNKNKELNQREAFIDDINFRRSEAIMPLENLNFGNKRSKWRKFNFHGDSDVVRMKRQIVDANDNCTNFMSNPGDETIITHPHNSTISKNYFSDVDCVRVISADPGNIITITFIDVFHIEEHPKCAYDYLEVRDGRFGYSDLLGRLCGDVFPPPISSSGPDMWLKFKSDKTIEYEGFTIKVEYIPDPKSHKVPEDCFIALEGDFGEVDISNIPEKCDKQTGEHDLDVLWQIKVNDNQAIYLNFSKFELVKPNECEENLVQVFGEITEEAKALEHYCGSAANAVTTKSEEKKTGKENVMHVRIMLTEKTKGSKVIANFTAFRTLDPNKDEQCPEGEYNCDDNTCIAKRLECDHYANCRLKGDEDPDKCDKKTTTLLQQNHIVIILVIFSVILSGMSFIFLFKCIRKLYQDHKAIKDHIWQSTEGRLDMLSSGSLILDPKGLREPRASLERENHTNELFNKKRSISQHKGLPQQTSIESDFQETPLDVDEEHDLARWRHDVDTMPEPDEVKVKAERNGKARRSDTSKKEETLRSRKESVEEKKEIRDAAVGAPDTKESGCQTRESLFQADTAPSSDGSNSASNSRGFSTFGYSGATLVRPSPPPAAAPAPMISSAQIELLQQLPSFEISHKPQRKLPDRRPMSAETTRSAPDVIIVSKPIR